MIRFLPKSLVVGSALGAMAILGTACGGGDSSSSGVVTAAPTKAVSTAAASTAATKAATTPAAATTAATSSTVGQKITTAPPAGSAVIDQKDQLFKPDKLTVKLGDTVYFTNSEAVVHSVNLDGKNLLGSGGLTKQGESVVWKPAKAGTYTMTCDYHPAMKAVVTVQ